MALTTLCSLSTRNTTKLSLLILVLRLSSLKHRNRLSILPLTGSPGSWGEYLPTFTEDRVSFCGKRCRTDERQPIRGHEAHFFRTPFMTPMILHAGAAVVRPGLIAAFNSAWAGNGPVAGYGWVCGACHGLGAKRRNNMDAAKPGCGADNGDKNWPDHPVLPAFDRFLVCGEPMTHSANRTIVRWSAPISEERG